MRNFRLRLSRMGQNSEFYGAVPIENLACEMREEDIFALCFQKVVWERFGVKLCTRVARDIVRTFCGLLLAKVPLGRG